MLNEQYPKPQPDQTMRCDKCRAMTVHSVALYPKTKLCTCQNCGHFFVVTLTQPRNGYTSMGC
jgi:uncharacterized Zn finger protein